MMRRVVGTVTSTQTGKPLAGVRVDLVLTDMPGEPGQHTILWTGATDGQGKYATNVDIPVVADARERPGQPAVHLQVTADAGRHVTFGDGKYLAEILGNGVVRLDMGAASDDEPRLGEPTQALPAASWPIQPAFPLMTAPGANHTVTAAYPGTSRTPSNVESALQAIKDALGGM